MADTDTGYAPKEWAFDEEVTKVFDDMLARSIPQYEVMRRACFDLACRYRQELTDIVDLGCSRGEAIAALCDKFGAHNHFVGIEVSPPMLEASRNRFKGLINCGVVDIKEHDLRQGLPFVKPSVVLSVFTLQFTPIEYRLKILHDCWKYLLPGGALIFVEKILGMTAEIDEVMVSLYYQLKSDHGYSQDEIQRKRLSLEGKLVPVTAHWNEELLKMSGFSQIDCFWRWMNFAGWIAIK